MVVEGVDRQVHAAAFKALVGALRGAVVEHVGAQAQSARTADQPTLIVEGLTQHQLDVAEALQLAATVVQL